MIPSELVIDGVPWAFELTDDMDNDAIGVTKRRKGVVLIASDLTNAIKEATFWHELIHTICASRDIKFFPGDCDEIEEQVATALGPALFSLFSANAEITWKYDCLE